MERSATSATPLENADPITSTDVLAIKVYLERREGLGEDAPPLLIINGRSGVIASFDGMGGAGGTTFSSGDEARSGAWFASRAAREALDGFLQARLDLASGSLGALRDDLASHFRDRLAERASKLHAAPSGLRTSLTKVLPTTVAMLQFRGRDEGVEYEALWAGDSRAYLFTPSEGLAQLSTDDLRSSGDAMQNLSQDSALSNFLQASGSFELRHRVGSAALPTLVMTATDGCFNYLETPAHFEVLVLETLARSETMSDWERALYERLSAIAGDDCALAAVAIGVKDLKQLRDAFRERLTHVRNTFVDPLDTLSADLAAAEHSVAALREEKSATRDRLWALYRQNYERACLPDGDAPSSVSD